MNIFYLEWINKRPSICEFRDSKPEKYNFECSVNIRGFKPLFSKVTLYGYFDESMEMYEFQDSPFTKKSYLISHLQKSIRKMKHDKSIKTAKHLIDLDISTLLRRLPIIMFEDVIPHISLPIIVWLMIAVTKGFRLKTVMIQWLLGVVYFLSSCKEHNQVHKKDSIMLDKLQENVYLKSLLIRISYGGMKGDMKMLNYFIDNWNTKFREGYHMDTTKIRYITHKLDRLLLQNWDLCANDFHCNPKLLDAVNQQYNLYSKDYIKTLIWEFSSKKNHRVEFTINKEEYKDWLIIRNYVRFLQKNMNFY